MSSSYMLVLLLMSSFATVSPLSRGESRHCIAFVPRDTGVTWSYSVSYSAQGAFDIARLLSRESAPVPPESAATRQSVGSTLKGVIRLRLASGEPDAVVAVLTGDVAATVAGNGDSAVLTDVHSLFARGFDVVFDSVGAIVGIRVRVGDTNGAVAFVRALLGIMQFEVPCSAWSRQTTHWARREADPNGFYEASYTIVPTAGERGTIAATKIKGTYLADSSGASSGATPILVRSSGHFTARLNRAARRITSLVGTDSQVVGALSASFGSSVTNVRLTFLDARRAGAVREEAAAGQTSAIVPLYVPGVASSANRRMAARTLEGRDVADVATALRDLNNTNGSAAATTPAFRLARAFILLQPTEVDSLGSLLGAEAGGSPAFRTFTAALASAGTPAAEHALATALRARIRDVTAARRIVVALGSMGTLTSVGLLALENAIERAPDERVSSEAALALGNAIHAMSARGDSSGASVVQWVGERLAAQPPAERRIALVNALGNSGSEAALHFLIAALDDSNPNVRAAAVQASSTFRDSVIRRHLTRILRTDTTAFVRLRAAAALDSIDDDAALMSAERDALLAERDADVRVQLVTNLWSVRERWPEIETLIRELGATDPADRVKELIARLLHS